MGEYKARLSQEWQDKLAMRVKKLPPGVPIRRKALARLWSSMSALAWRYANKFTKRYPCMATIDDWHQQLYLFMLMALKTYDADRGPFINYLTRVWRTRAALYSDKHLHPTSRPTNCKDDWMTICRITDTGKIKVGKKHRFADPDVQDRAAALLSKLPEDERRLIRARYFDGKSVQDIADESGQSRLEVRKQECAALRRMGV